ncbi:MAG: hypothetical protein QOD06_1925 [Candidatus Binatota bacterium]|nr:hypothetical protein [Candidatus Binatota bacterium]
MTQARTRVDERERLRAELLARVPSWYLPWLHLAIPSAFAIAVVASALAGLDDVTGWELLAVPLTYVITNANEWRIHRDLLHRRSPVAPLLYTRHTPEHHALYVAGDMQMRDRREFRLVLIPAYGLFLIFASLAPVAGALWLIVGRNVALLYTATAMAYALLYEWLHLAYHLPPESPIGRVRAVSFLRRHHEIHHDPRLMRHWNFNVTVPLWDWVRGTLIKDPA